MQISKKQKMGLAVTLAAVLAGCGGGGDGQVQQTADGYLVDSGLAQKGPLARGSVVTLNELAVNTLAPNGKSYTYETRDDHGTFFPTSKFTSPYLETTAQGYYFNEVTGKSEQWVALRGLSNLSVGADRTVNVNVLSDVTTERIRKLVTGRPVMAFNAARAQAQRELLNALGIANGAELLSGSASAPGNFMELDLSQARQADQALAAISGLVSHVGNLRKSEGGVTAFLGELGADLADDGQLNNSIKLGRSVTEQLQQAALAVNFSQVATNLNQFYGKQLYSRTDLAQWVDSSGGSDQVLDRYKYSRDNVLLGQESLSPAWVAGADDAGQCFSVSGGVLYKNGVQQDGAVLAVKGDQFTLGITPAEPGAHTEYIQRSAAVAAQCTGQTPAIRLLQYQISVAAQASMPVPADYLGANLPNITDYAYTPVYVDLVKQARAFGPTDRPWGGATDVVPVGSDGWPTGDFGLFLMAVPGLEGTYKLSFTGQASVSLNASYNTRVENLRYDATLNRTTADVVRGPNADNPSGAQMVLIFKNTGTGIKDLKVVRPGYDAFNPPLFTNEFIDHIARFKVLRFMEWLRTNNNSSTSWATRAPLNRHHMSAAGVPWEHVIALANQTQKDIWINIPVAADDDYVLQLAGLLKSMLNGSSKIYVEYSNELWNSQFKQFGTNRDLATQELYDNPKSVLAYDGKTHVDVIGYRRIAKRGKEISDIFRSVYGDAAMMTTVRPVFASQVVQNYVAQLGLAFIDAVYGPSSRYFYAFAGAPYFNLGSLQQVDGLSADTVLQALDDSVTALPKQAYFEKNVAFASWYGLPFFAYEAGADTFGPGSIAAKKAASLDPRMLDLCKRYLSTWYAGGGQMLMWYTAGASNWDTQYGTWGLTTDLALTDTPKTQCIDQTRNGLLPPVKARNQVPGSFDALAYVENFEPYAERSKDQIRYLHPESSVDYLIYAPQAGSYGLVITAEAGRSGNLIDVMVNSKTVAPAFELRAGGFGVQLDNSPIAINLSQGFSTLRIKTKVENGGFGLTRFTVR
ncbi:MAG: hypothetical protein A2486_08120 [Burkholderiales bacterium RIFOXYC12_FULL_65_23]|uniref:hypothetical protein n=1 Tax=Malikia spinosa TaxID=86180 RepID=UPI0008D76E2F|nr:MAG: hypothetical protein A2486_08120 [Burkholderiales bacterium RIFOXYC12_FULL_65_23]